MASPVFTIVPARTPDDIASVAELFREYAASLGVDLSFQHFDSELAALPGDYSEPQGTLLLAVVQSAPAGCVGLRPLEPGICEMKRLYVRPAYRGMKIGDALAAAIIAAARDRGYTRMRLDTLPSMHTARGMYARLGFREIESYRFNPIEGTSFMELALT